MKASPAKPKQPIPTGAAPDTPASVAGRNDAGLNAAKNAAILPHTAPGLTHEEARRCAALIPCLALDIRCSGPPISLLPHRENRPDGPPSLCPEYGKPTKAGARMRHIPCRREFACAAAPDAG